MATHHLLVLVLCLAWGLIAYAAEPPKLEELRVLGEIQRFRYALHAKAIAFPLEPVRIHRKGSVQRAGGYIQGETGEFVREGPPGGQYALGTISLLDLQDPSKVLRTIEYDIKSDRQWISRRLNEVSPDEHYLGGGEVSAFCSATPALTEPILTKFPDTYALPPAWYRFLMDNFRDAARVKQLMAEHGDSAVEIALLENPLPGARIDVEKRLGLLEAGDLDSRAVIVHATLYVSAPFRARLCELIRQAKSTDYVDGIALGVCASINGSRYEAKELVPVVRSLRAYYAKATRTPLSNRIVRWLNASPY